MRKRFVTTIIVCLIALIGAFGFSGCFDKDGDENNQPITVAGNTFVFQSVYFEYSDKVTDEDKATWGQEAIDEVTEAYKDRLTISFDKNGNWEQQYMNSTVASGTYTQSEDKITLLPETDEGNHGKVEGNNFTLISSWEGITQYQVFTLVTSPDDGKEEGGEQGGKDEEGNTSSVAGKTFVFDSCKFTFADNVDQSLKNTLNSTLSYMEDSYQGLTITFKADGTFIMTTLISDEINTTGRYTQNNGEISMTADAMDFGDFQVEEETLAAILEGNILTLSQDYGEIMDMYKGVTLELNYKVQA